MITNFSLTTWLVVVLSILSTADPSQAQSAPTYPVVIAATGDPIPGSTIGETFGTVETGAMDDLGRVVFRGTIVSPNGIPDVRAYFYGSDRSGLTTIIRSGDPEPSGTIAGATVDLAIGTDNRRISSNGIILLGMRLSGGGTTPSNNSALYAGSPGGLQILARRGDPAPGAGSALYDASFDSLVVGRTGINSAGQAAFRSGLTGPGVVGSSNNAAVFVGSVGSVTMVLRKGDLGPAGEVISGVADNMLQLNANGAIVFDVAYQSGTGNPAVTTANDRAVYLYTPAGGLVVLAREGNPALGTPYTYGSSSASPFLIGSCHFNAAGRALLRADLLGGPPGGGDQSLVLFGPSGPSPIAVSGSMAPGVAGATFQGFNVGVAALNDSDQVAFAGLLNGPGIFGSNDSGIWAGTVGNLSLVVREGDIAPGTGGGVFGTVFSTTLMQNAAGEILFTSTLSGGTNPGNSMWAWDPVRGLRAVVTSGQMLETSPGVIDTVSNVSSTTSSNSDSRSLAFANDGTVAFRLTLAGGRSANVVFSVRGSICIPPPICCVHAVFVVPTNCDTASIVPNLCSAIAMLQSYFASVGVTFSYAIHGITKTLLPCVTTDVKTVFGPSIPSFFFYGGGILGDCSMVFRGDEMDWGPAVSIVADRNTWPANCTRLVIPLVHQGPRCGDPVASDDLDQIRAAIGTAVGKSVIVSPIVHPYATSSTKEMAQKIASGTGGITTVLGDIDVPSLVSAVRRAVLAPCCVDLPPDAVAWWPFDDSNTISAEILQFNHAFVGSVGGSTNYPTRGPGKVDKAMYFDVNLATGVDFLYVNDPVTGALDMGAGQDFTIEAWIRPDPSTASINTTTVMTLCEKIANVPPISSNEYGYRFFLYYDASNKARLGLVLADGTATTYYAGALFGQVPIDGAWHFVCVSVDRDGGAMGIKFFRDGIDCGTGDPSAHQGTLDNPNALLIGAGNPTGSPHRGYTGGIDELTIYKRALTSAECCAVFFAADRGKCGRAEAFLGDCSFNIVDNGSFEKGSGSANGKVGSDRPFTWVYAGHSPDAYAEWGGDGGFSGDTTSSEADKCLPNTDIPDGHRWVYLHDPIFEKQHPSIVNTLKVPLVAGPKYALRWSASRSKNSGLTRNEKLQVFLGPVSGVYQVLWEDFLEKPLAMWHDYSIAFNLKSALTGTRRFGLQSMNGRGFAVDGVCLQMIGGGAPVGNWPCDCDCDNPPPPGGFSLEDLMGAHAGTLSGTWSTVDGVIDRALSFDGQTGYAQVAANPSLDIGSGDFTIAAWIQPRDVASMFQPIVDKFGPSPTATSAGYRLGLTQGRPFVTLSDGTNVMNYIAPNALPADAWAHVAVTFWRSNCDDGLRIYVNGRVVASFDPTGVSGSIQNTEVLTFGRGVFAGGPATVVGYFDGALDDMQIYRSVLPLDDIRLLKRTGIPELPKFDCYVTPIASFLVGQPSRTIAVTVTNNAVENSFCSWSLQGDAPNQGGEYPEVDGTTTFTPSSGELKLRPGETRTIIVTMNQPAALVPRTRAPYSLIVRDRDSLDFTASYGKAASDATIEVLVASDAVDVRSGAQVSTGFSIRNNGTTAVTMPFQIRAERVTGDRKDTAILSGVTPGSPILGTVTVAPGATTMIPFGVGIDTDRANFATGVLIDLQSPVRGAPISSSVVVRKTTR